MLFVKTDETRTCRDLRKTLRQLNRRLEPTRDTALLSGDPWNPLFAGVMSGAAPAQDEPRRDIAEVERAMFDEGCDLPGHAVPKAQRAPTATVAPLVEQPPVTVSQ